MRALEHAIQIIDGDNVMATEATSENREGDDEDLRHSGRERHNSRHGSGDSPSGEPRHGGRRHTGN